jgi:hypothetical protein
VGFLTFEGKKCLPEMRGWLFKMSGNTIPMTPEDLNPQKLIYQ